MRPQAADKILTQLAGLGIDIVALKRIRRLIKAYGPKLADKILCPSEKMSRSARKFSAVELAKKFSAKEAYFKTLNFGWMGIEGFQSIEIKSLSKNHFLAWWLENGNRTREAEGCFYHGRTWVAAQAIRFRKSIDHSPQSIEGLNSMNHGLSTMDYGLKGSPCVG